MAESDESNDDRVVIYQTKTVDVDPAEIDQEWWEQYVEKSDVEFARGEDRLTADHLGGAGREPDPYICPECGEHCQRANRTQEETEFKHTVNTDCARHYDPRSPTSQTSRERDWKVTAAVNLVSVITISGVFAAIAWFVPKPTFSVNGQPVAVPLADTVVAVIALMFVVWFSLTVLPNLYRGVVAR